MREVDTGSQDLDAQCVNRSMALHSTIVRFLPAGAGARGIRPLVMSCSPYLLVGRMSLLTPSCAAELIRCPTARRGLLAACAKRLFQEPPIRRRRPRVSFAALLILLLGCCECDAAVGVGVSPKNPTGASDIQITVGVGWFPDTGQQVVDSRYNRSGSQIELSLYLQDLHGPGRVFAQIMTWESETFSVGRLPVGSYNVSETVYMQPWYGGPFVPYGWGSSAFAVEVPSTLKQIKLLTLPQTVTNLIIQVDPSITASLPSDLTPLTNYVVALEKSFELGSSNWVLVSEATSLPAADFVKGEWYFAVPISARMELFRVAVTPASQYVVSGVGSQVARMKDEFPKSHGGRVRWLNP